MPPGDLQAGGVAGTHNGYGGTPEYYDQGNNVDILDSNRKTMRSLPGDDICASTVDGPSLEEGAPVWRREGTSGECALRTIIGGPLARTRLVIRGDVLAKRNNQD